MAGEHYGIGDHVPCWASASFFPPQELLEQSKFPED